MFDIGWSELLLIAIVALIVVGPRDLPGMFRTLGRFTAKARSMAREFSRAMEDAAKESGVNEAAKDLREMTSKKRLGLDALEDAARKFEKWDPMKGSAAPKGPATQALADKKAAEAEARAAARTAGTQAQAGSPEPEAKAKSAPAKAAPKAAAAKPATAKPATAKPAAKEPAAAKPASAKPAAAKPATAKAAAPKPRKAPAKKGDA